MIIFTKIDEISEELRQKPDKENAILKEKWETVAVETRLQKMHVFPALGYVVESTNNIYVDRFTLDLLFTAMQLVNQVRQGKSQKTGELLVKK